MRGYQQIERKIVLWSNMMESRQAKMLLASIAVGAVAGFVVAIVRLNLGLPGHKALFWMIPIITMRLAGRCKIGAMAGTVGVVLSTFSLGGQLAGGPLGLGMIIVAGCVLDIAINFLEQRKRSKWSYAVLLCVITMICNLLCLVKRLFTPNGVGFHLLFGNLDFWFRFTSYAVFGLVSGLISWVVASRISKYQ